MTAGSRCDHTPSLSAVSSASRLLPVTGAQERRGLERECQMRLQVADQQRAPPRGRRSACRSRDLLVEALHQRARLLTPRRAFSITPRSRWNRALAEAGPYRDLVGEHFLRRVNAQPIGQKMENPARPPPSTPGPPPSTSTESSRASVYRLVLGRRMAVLVRQQGAQRNVVCQRPVALERAAVHEHRAFASDRRRRRH